jgi:hypothetical protein
MDPTDAVPNQNLETKSGITPLFLLTTLRRENNRAGLPNSDLGDSLGAALPTVREITHS